MQTLLHRSVFVTLLVVVGAGLLAGQSGTTAWTSIVSRATAAVVVIETDRGLGSGFVVRPNGILVTNQHVVADASQISVTFSSGEKYQKAFVLAEDKDTDLAILRIEGSDLPALPMARTAELGIGEEVLLIGAPEGLSHTVSTGVVSAIRLLKDGMKVIQTTAPASPGSSGGPLISREGSVVGVLTFQFSEGQNLNFAVPSNYVQRMMETVEKFSAGTPLRTLTRLISRPSSASPSRPGEFDLKAAEAQYTLGVMYGEGRGVPQDDAEAVKWYRMAAEQGLAEAQYNLGFMYGEGRGVPQNEAEAVKWYRMAAEQGLAEAQHSLGFSYTNFRMQDYAEAVKWFRMAAEQGLAGAQSLLGLMYLHGRGAPQDHREAVNWYRKAAEQGHTSAQDALGTMYREGEGVPQDYAQAVKWYRMAAEQGDADAQTNLGLMYATGKGLPIDYLQGHKWLNLAASKSQDDGLEKSVRLRAILSERLTPDQIAEAQRLAREWKPKTWDELKKGLEATTP